jgi:spermidine/putrescine transport system ATP-binding protein
VKRAEMARAETERTESERAAGEPAVRLVGLSRRFGELTAVNRLDLMIAEGEFFSLIGPSGCGKTTTLRLIAGLESPSEGSVFVRGRDLTRVPAFRRPVNTVFQNYALFPHLTVFENVAFGLRERRLSRREIAGRVHEMLRLVALSARDRAKPRELSGGQQQRVALARALVMEPQVLLLDEPLGALDLKLRKQMQALLKQIQRDVGITFVYVTHDQEEAFSMSDRVAVMNEGVIEQEGLPTDVYRRPRTLFVADFVGASNRIEGVVRNVAGKGEFEVELAIDGSRQVTRGVDDLRPGSTVALVVRPEIAELVDMEAGEGLPARVRDVAYLGPQIVVTVDAEGGIQLTVISSGVSGAERFDPGDQVLVRWDSSLTWAVPG